MRSILAMTAMFAAAPALALAQSGANDSKPGRQFVEHIAQSNQSEIMLGLLAERQGQDAAVKAVARLMVDDHAAAAEGAISELARSQAIDLKGGPGAEGRQAMEKLRGLNGAEFDRAFVETEVQNHTNDVKLYQDESNANQAPALSGYAKLVLPIQEQHLAIMKVVQAQLAAGKPANQG